MLIAALLVAGLLRFWQLEQIPPGLYRDEAYNGLDARAVLAGEHALFFPANNGREPLYIYLTSAAVALFGSTAFAVRAAAALAGTLTTPLIFLLGDAWFGRRTGLLAAWLWAITLWPIHLSRLGLRAILVAPLLGLLLWVGTLAFRRRQPQLWFLAGLLLGAGFYTYLAFRFVPLLLAALTLYLLWQGRGRRLWPGAAWFSAGTALALAPLGIAALGNPAILGLGRLEQVSIFSEPGALGTLLQQTGRALGLFIWRGDTILRHNPAGRPAFDLLLAGPWLLGVLVCVRQWRQPAAAALLLWQLIMLGPTILAADAPHFLRAAGLLPGLVLLPARGLSQIWSWSKLPGWVRRLLPLLIVGSGLWTVADYRTYAADAETGYLFESAAVELAHVINQEPAGTPQYLDTRFREGWASLPFLLRAEAPVVHYQPPDLPLTSLPARVYAWPFDDLGYVADAAGEAAVTISTGPLARGDLEPAAYPLYVQFGLAPLDSQPVLITFDNAFIVYGAEAVVDDQQQVTVRVTWSYVGDDAQQPLKLFVHAAGNGGLIGQADFTPGQGYWPRDQWPSSVVTDVVSFRLTDPFDAGQHQLLLGLYNAATSDRYAIRTAAGSAGGDSWRLTPVEEFSSTGGAE